MSALAVALLTAALTGCDNRAEGEALAKAGAATSESLATYYDSLVQETVDIWEYEAFNVAIRNARPSPSPTPAPCPRPGAGVPAPAERDDEVEETITFSPAQQRRLQTQIDALSRRAKLARRLLSTYNSLKELSTYDASGAVKTSAENLATSITNLTPLPDAGVNPSTFFGMVASDIIKWKQSRDIRKGSELILKAVDGLQKLFENESAAYKSITRERNRKLMIVAKYMIRNKHVLALPLLQKVPEALGIRLAGGDSPVANCDTIEALVGMMDARMQRYEFLSGGTADGVAQALQGLAENHRELQAKRGLSLDSLLEGLARAQAYVDEIKKLREGMKSS